MGMPYYAPLQGLHGGKRTLVLLDNMPSKQLYTSFWTSLASAGYELDFKTPSSPAWNLKKYGEYLYDNVVIFAPKADDFGKTTFKDLLAFVDDGGNVLMAADDRASESTRAFAESSGVRLDASGTKVVDHFASNSNTDRDMSHASVLLGAPAVSANVLGEGVGNVLYKGISMRMAASNELTTGVLAGNPTSYVSDATASSGMLSDTIGSNMVLVAAVQARNNARMTISGSLKLFSNEYILEEGCDNANFALRLAKWTFGANHVLRFRDIQHSQEDGTPPDVILHEKERPDLPQSLYPDPEITRNSLVYRIKDRITYSMVVEELTDEGWAPFLPDDMQMEFVMLDPYVRTTMTPNHTTGRVETTFDAPDDYGIYKFRVLYRRPGYSVLHAETKVSLRPFKHDEYERFIFAAYPYYLSSLAMGVAFVVFSVVFLSLDEPNKVEATQSADAGDKSKKE